MLAPAMLAASTIPASPVFALMAMGIVVAIAGHITRHRRTVAVGVTILFLATALMMVLAYAAYRGDEPDPRPPKSPSTPGF
jgi:uncharacterized membrane protein